MTSGLKNNKNNINNCAIKQNRFELQPGEHEMRTHAVLQDGKELSAHLEQRALRPVPHTCPVIDRGGKAHPERAVNFTLLARDYGLPSL